MTTYSNVRSLDNPLCHLAEGPLWHADEGKLYWTDILERRIWRYDPGSGNTSLWWEGAHQVGGFAFRAGGGLVLCTDHGVFTLVRGQLTSVCPLPLLPDMRCNDVTTDPVGRLLIGTMTPRQADGQLLRLEKGKDPVVMLDGLGVSNGMTFSLDQRFFYHTDSPTRTITRFRYDLNSGTISDSEPFYQGQSEDGYPDGITMDTEGGIWVACWGGSQVIRLDEDGEIVARVKVPAVQPSSVMFGGPSRSTLYITSACESGDPETGRDASGRFLGGFVYAVETGTEGRPEWFADFPA